MTFSYETYSLTKIKSKAYVPNVTFFYHKFMQDRYVPICSRDRI